MNEYSFFRAKSEEGHKVEELSKGRLSSYVASFFTDASGLNKKYTSRID